MPRIEHGDCLDILTKSKGGPFDLVYLDPPYFLAREHVLEQGSEVSFTGEFDAPRDELYDALGVAAGAPRLSSYLAWLDVRLRAVRDVMAKDASLFLHVGPREGAYVRVVLDRVFGLESWRATITWQRSHPHNNIKRALGNVSDHIYYYTRSRGFTFNVLHTPHDAKYLSGCFSHRDERGEYALAPIVQERSRKGHHFAFRGHTPPHGWRVRRETLEAYEAAGRIHWGQRRPYKKIYLHEARGAPLQTVWADIHNITRTERDRRRYPTQKPLALLERIVALASVPGARVLDPFCGSGTTLVAARRLGRVGLGIDASAAAVEVARARLAAVEGEGLIGGRPGTAEESGDGRAPSERTAGSQDRPSASARVGDAAASSSPSSVSPAAARRASRRKPSRA